MKNTLKKNAGKYFVAPLAVSALFLGACGSDSLTQGSAGSNEVSLPFFENGDSVAVDFGSCTIELPEAQDSLVIGNFLSSLGGSHYYLATDGDLNQPDFDWDNPLEPGSVIKAGQDGFANIVVLDSDNCVVAVWQIKVAASESSSSESDEVSSSSEESAEEESSSSVVESSADAESSSSESDGGNSSAEMHSSSSGAETSSSAEDGSSSSAVVTSSSSETVSSSSEIRSSSSETELSSSETESSSSSVEMESSSSETVAVPVKLSSLSVTSGSVTVDEHKIFIDLPYDSDLKHVQLSPLDTTNDLTRPVEMEFENEFGSVETYSVLAGVQLPGSDFSNRVDSFWGTTSDAMILEGWGTYKVPLLGFTVDVSMKAKKPNAVFEDGQVTLTTESIVGHSTGFDGGWKMAAGFYFAGTYRGENGASIYQADNSDAGADNRAADFSQYMRFGRPFTARPSSFEVTYAYEHFDNTNDKYPQTSMIYVVLVSSNNKIVAAGMVSDYASVEKTTKKVDLAYGSDAGLLATGCTGLSDLSVGTGNEDVASIRVMFTSSTLAYVADGGSSSQMEKNFRGGEGSKLILDNFKLVY